jgi:hypothetical protein
MQQKDESPSIFPIGSDVTREELHFRRIDMRGFRRSDGLFEVESRLTDRKSYDFVPSCGGRVVAAGDPIHDMGVRLVFDDQMQVHGVQTFTDAAPYAECPEGGRALQSLIGLRMTSGWSKEVRTRLSGARSCTHLMELLTPLATVAFQSLSVLRRSRTEPLDANERPLRVDMCYAYGAERELVRHYWPQFYRPASSTE